MDIHILRDGKQTGPFSEESVQVLLKQGSIVINDLAWQQGMPEWLPLHAVLYPAAQPSVGHSPAQTYHPVPPTPGESSDTDFAAEPQVVEEETDTISPEAPPLSEPEPATPRQKAFLTFIGTPFKASLTKEKAALLVNDAMENPKNGGKLKRWEEERLRLYPDLFGEEIKAKRENRAEYLLEVCQTEAAEFFEGVTKAHAQVLVGYLDVRFPNWEQDDRSAKYDYFFPAISEKFPQLLRKGAKGRFKYPEGPRVAPELVRRSVAIRGRPARSFVGAVVRGVVLGSIVVGLIIAAVKYGRGELKLPFDLPTSLAQIKAGTAKSAGKHASLEEASSAPRWSAEGGTTSTPSATGAEAAAAPVSTSPSTQPPSSAPAHDTLADVSPPKRATETGSGTNSPGAAAVLPSSVSLFDSAPPPPAATPAPARTATTAPTTSAPQVMMGRINKPTLVSLKFGTSTLRPGTQVQVMSVNSNSVKIKFGPEIAVVPASSVDLPQGASASTIQ